VTRWSRSKLALNLDPDLPVELKHRIGRLADNWRPLIAIADSFGLVWGKVAREAAVTFARSHHDEDIGVILLSDIRNIFNRTGADRMTSVDLITALLDVEESGWSEYQGVRDDQQPRKVSAGEMARLLKPFGIRPRSVWPIASAAKASAAAKATTVRSASRLGHAIAMSQAAHRHKTVKSHTSEAAKTGTCAGVPGEIRGSVNAAFAASSSGSAPVPDAIFFRRRSIFLVGVLIFALVGMIFALVGHD
jgi:hypothetical protein